MPDVVGIRFKNCGKIYDFEVNGCEISKGSLVVVESEFGLGIGSVVIGPRPLEDSGKSLKKILRVATEKDIGQKKDNEAYEQEAHAFCLERIMARGIPMKLVCTEATLDRKRIVFYFTADGRIDFRELVKDLAARFKTRIEMRQIGVRDQAKFIGGLGLCGKDLCCRVFLTSFEPISIKMAKQQELSLNTGKLSGVCGRLMCCLGFEYDEQRIDKDTAADEDEITVSEKEEVLTVVTGDPEDIAPETPPDSVETMKDASAQQQSVPSPQTEQTQTRRRRRRRRRRRKGKFHKKDE